MNITAELKRLNALHPSDALTDDTFAAAPSSAGAGLGGDPSASDSPADALAAELARVRQQLAIATLVNDVAQLDRDWERAVAAYRKRYAFWGHFHIGPFFGTLPPRAAGFVKGIVIAGWGIVWAGAVLLGRPDEAGFRPEMGFEHNAMVISVASLGIVVAVLGIRSIAKARRHADDFDASEQSYLRRRSELLAGRAQAPSSELGANDPS